MSNNHGRPRDYKPEFDEIAYELMSEGASKVEVAAELNIARSTLYDWIDPKSERFQPSFSDTIKLAETKCQAWWERQGRLGLKEKFFQTGLWTMNMKNRFSEDWKDKQEVDYKDISQVEVTYESPDQDT